MQYLDDWRVGDDDEFDRAPKGSRPRTRRPINKAMNGFITRPNTICAMSRALMSAMKVPTVEKDRRGVTKRIHPAEHPIRP
jgi:hypothetical protein